MTHDDSDNEITEREQEIFGVACGFAHELAGKRPHDEILNLGIDLIRTISSGGEYSQLWRRTLDDVEEVFPMSREEERVFSNHVALEFLERFGPSRRTCN